MVILSTMSLLAVRRPLPSDGSTAIRNKGASVFSDVNTQILIDCVASKSPRVINAAVLASPR